MKRLIAVAGFVCLVTLAPPARGHESGRVQLFLHALDVVPAGDDTWLVNVTLIDADSGRAATGMDVTARASGGPAPAAGPVRLDDTGRGAYSGRLVLAPGRWTITIRARAVPGGEPAVPLEHSSTVTLEPGSGADPPASPARSAVPDRVSLEVHLERTSQPGPGPLWVPVLATVTDSGRPFTAPHTVFVVATDAGGTESEPFELNPVQRADPAGRPGTHRGFVILPSGGRWTLTATVTNPPPEAGGTPDVLGRGGSLEVDVPEPPVTVAARTRSAEEAIRVPGEGNLTEAGLRWGHTLLAIGWAVGVGLLALLALPQGRSLLSDHAVTVLDYRLETITRITWFLTGLVVLTGTIQLVRWTPYEIPLSSGRAERLFVLPWAKPYFLALAVKLVAYTGLIALSVPLMRQARRQAAAWVEPDGRPRSDDRTPAWLRLAPAGLLVGVATLTLMVTLLLYFHRMSEVARLG